MSVRGDKGKRSSMATGLTLAGAVCVLALPSAVLAFSSRFDPPPASASASGLESFASSAEDAHLASANPVRSLVKDRLFRFTPAGTPTRPDRSVTVAVRVDPRMARAITVRGSRIAASSAAGTDQLPISPNAFKLGVSRGYQSFAQALAPSSDSRGIEMPDLAAFKPGTGERPAASRFAPRITLDEKQAAGRAPRTFAGDSEDSVDVGGSYRVTRNLNVTAGVRYSEQERDRLRPLTDGKQDNQAVYVGTQFRF